MHGVHVCLHEASSELCIKFRAHGGYNVISPGLQEFFSLRCCVINVCVCARACACVCVCLHHSGREIESALETFRTHTDNVECGNRLSCASLFINKSE